MDISFELKGEQFVWNDTKARRNLVNHGVAFEEAATVFSDPMFKIVQASRNDEARDAAIGFDAQGRVLFVVHIEVEDSHIRIISARRATASEEDVYAQ